MFFLVADTILSPDKPNTSIASANRDGRLAEAMVAVENGMSLRQAAKLFNITYSSFWRHCHLKNVKMHADDFNMNDDIHY